VSQIQGVKGALLSAVSNCEPLTTQEMACHWTSGTPLVLFRSNPDQFDQVITDMAMPQMDGDKPVKEILTIRLEMPIIIKEFFSDRS
jgi:CheY-like chemotaxis protein